MPDVTLGRVERMVTMRGFPGWSDASAGDLAILASATRVRAFARGEILQPADDPAARLWMIVSGEVRVVADGVETGRFGEQSAVGGLAAFSGREQGYEISALEDTVALEITSADMEEVFEERFGLLLRVLRAMAGMCVDLRLQLPRAGFDHEAEVGPVCPARPLDLVERILTLGDNLAMGGQVDSLAVIARYAHELRYDPGHVIWEAGEPASHFVTLVCGRVRCTTPAGAEWIMGANDMIGGLGSLAQRPRWFRAEVLDGVVGLSLRRDVTIDIWEDHPDIAMRVLRTFAGSALDLQRRVGAHTSP